MIKIRNNGCKRTLYLAKRQKEAIALFLSNVSKRIMKDKNGIEIRKGSIGHTPNR